MLEHSIRTESKKLISDICGVCPMVIKHRTAEITTVVMSAIIVISFVALTNQFVQIVSAQNKTSAGTTNTTSTASNNATSGNKSSSNPLANVPIIGKLFGK
jgi:hypothetical protein